MDRHLAGVNMTVSVSFGVGCFYFAAEGTGEERRGKVDAVLRGLPGVRSLDRCELPESSKHDELFRDKRDLPLSLPSSIPTSGLVQFTLLVGEDTQRHLLNGSEPRTGTEMFRVYVRYSHLLPVGFVECQGAILGSSGSQAVWVVAQYLNDWWGRRNVVESTGVRFVHFAVPPFPSDASFELRNDASPTLEHAHDNNDGRRMDKFSIRNLVNSETVAAIETLQKYLAPELSYTFYAAHLSALRRKLASKTEGEASELIKAHASQSRTDRFRRLFYGDFAQDIALQALKVRLTASQHDKFHDRQMEDLLRARPTSAYADVADSFALQKPEPSLDYAGQVVSVLEERRRNDFQVYMAAIIGLFSILALVMVNLFN